MMIWIFFLLLALFILLGFWRVGAFTKATLPLLGVAMLLAAAGYTWQGRPGLAGSPVQPSGQELLPESAFSVLRGEFFGQFTAASRWLIISDSYRRRGDTESAAGVLASALSQYPDNVELWIGYGDALVLHGGGVMSPAAELAYRRAMALAPDHPAARFFYGFSLIQGGQIGAGEKVWRDLLAGVCLTDVESPTGRSPTQPSTDHAIGRPGGGADRCGLANAKDAKWRPIVADRLAIIDRLKAMRPPGN